MIETVSDPICEVTTLGVCSIGCSGDDFITIGEILTRVLRMVHQSLQPAITFANSIPPFLVKDL